MPQNKTDSFDLLDDPEILAEPVKPEAAIEFWKQRAKLTWDEAKGLADGAKARAFYVTGLYQLDLVNMISDALQKALEDGELLEDFKKRIEEAITKQGWKGYRVETIFRTNMQSAYAAGRYRKMQAVMQSRPYWQYLAIMDKRTRPSHAILHEKVYPADHEFWSANYPPNGFRCRCGVATLSQRQVDAQGLTVEKDMPQPGVWTDPKTKMEYFVNFPGADKGFANNPFKDWANGGNDSLPMLCERLEKAKPEVAAASVRRIVKDGFEMWAENPAANFPLCVLKKADAEAIGAKGTLAVISPETMRKQKAHHPELTPEDYARGQEAVENGEKYADGPLNLIFVLNEPGGVVVIVKATRTGNGLFVTSLRRMSGDRAKRNEEIERLKTRKKKG